VGAVPQDGNIGAGPGITSVSLVEGEDYYLENGFLVFTEKYLSNRGYCCGSGCRHCPYRKRRQPSQDAAEDDLTKL
jgi:hypothetical protein